MEKILKLIRVGKNYWGHIAYKDEESGKFYLDIDETVSIAVHCN